MKKIDLLEKELSLLKSHGASEEEIADCEKRIKRSKTSRRNKDKGGEYERFINKRFMDFDSRLDLARTPSSGGFKKSANNSLLRGDGSNLNEEVDFILHLEMKNCQEWKLREWITQAESDCTAGKIPVVCFHQQQKVINGKVKYKSEHYICMKLEDFLTIVDKNAIIKDK